MQATQQTCCKLAPHQNERDLFQSLDTVLQWHILEFSKSKSLDLSETLLLCAC